MNIARNIPILVAFLRLSTGTAVAIEMKMMYYSRQFLERSMLIGDPSIRI
jgi:hypothetical protein